jgi:hypothetical protein
LWSVIIYSADGGVEVHCSTLNCIVRTAIEGRSEKRRALHRLRSRDTGWLNSLCDMWDKTAYCVNVSQAKRCRGWHPLSQCVTYRRSSSFWLYRVIPSVLVPRKCEYLKDYSLDFEYIFVKYLNIFINLKYIYKILNSVMNSHRDIRIFLGLVPKESPCIYFNSFDTELNPICHPLALLGTHHIIHVSR